jgi:hypothetical protein
MENFIRRSCPLRESPARRKRPLRFLVLLLLILMIAQHSPAPIVEEEKPTPAPEQAAKPKAKPVVHSQTNRTKTSSRAVSTSTPARAKKFAGTWTGTMQTFPAGNQTTQILIDPTETTMTVSWFGKTSSAKAQLLSGDTLQATFPPPPLQPQSHVWSITPQADGQSARAHFQCFMNDFTAVFQRTAR